MDNKISENPLDYVTQEDIKKLGLTPSDLSVAYQPSKGGVYHARGGENKGKTLWVAHRVRNLVDKGVISPENGAGNLTFKGKYGVGFQVLKGDDLRQYLWDMTHKPYKGVYVIIDEIDSEFPARLFTDREQTEIALRMWHVSKLGNRVFMTSHIGNSADVIFHLATHYYIYPNFPNFQTNSLSYTVYNRLSETITDWTTWDIIPSMLIYNRGETTENTEEERHKIRPSLIKRQGRTHKEKENHLEDSFLFQDDFETIPSEGLPNY